MSAISQDKLKYYSVPNLNSPFQNYQISSCGWFSEVNIWFLVNFKLLELSICLILTFLKRMNYNSEKFFTAKTSFGLRLGNSKLSNLNIDEAFLEFDHYNSHLFSWRANVSSKVWKLGTKAKAAAAVWETFLVAERAEKARLSFWTSLALPKKMRVFFSV